MKIQFLAGTALAVVIAAGTANAADLAPVYKAAAPIPFSWTGFYIGAHVGAGTGSSPFDAQATGVDFHSASLGARKNTGFIGGGQAGYNWQTGMTVVGVEADGAWTGMKPSGDTLIDPFFHNKGFATFTTQVDWLVTVRGRIGIAATPSFLLYVTGGGAAAGVNIKYSGGGQFGLPLVNASGTQTAYGWTAGFGGEYAFSNNWSVKAEYLRVSLSDKSLNVPFIPASGLGGRVTTSLDIDLIRAGINYRF